jgi:hypothetical protein
MNDQHRPRSVLRNRHPANSCANETDGVLTH